MVGCEVWVGHGFTGLSVGIQLPDDISTRKCRDLGSPLNINRDAFKLFCLFLDRCSGFHGGHQDVCWQNLSCFRQNVGRKTQHKDI